MLRSLLQSMLHSSLAKVLALLLLTLLLNIPLDEIRSLIAERRESQQEAAMELAQTYAGAQTLIGPLLVVPYVERWSEDETDGKGKLARRVSHSAERVHVVFPDTLHVEGSMAPQERYRGIFKVPFYTLEAALQGGFAPFDIKALPALQKNSTLALAARAPYVVLSVADLRGLDGTPVLTIAEQSLRFAQGLAGLEDAGWETRGVHAPLAGAALAAWSSGQPMPFELTLRLVGQQTLSVVPIGGETTAHITSPWPHPSFGGHFLAAERSITPQGFDARWRVSALVSSAREQLREAVPPATATDMAQAATEAVALGKGRRRTAADRGPLQSFDISLAQPLNVYAMSSRAAKYGMLFIGLVLMAAFMFELFRKLRLHPVQYALVGLSIALFFLLLVALSEKFVFALAYAMSAAASVLLLAVYFSAVLDGWRRGVSLGAFVAVLYGALFGLLASESNALLLGSLLVFGMLSSLMLMTRRVDWYALSSREPAASSAPSSASGAALPAAAPLN